MRIIDTHLHAIWMSGPNILKMSMGGVEAAIQPTPHAVPWKVSGETLIKMWEDSISYWVTYCTARGVDLYSTLSVPFIGVDAEGIKEGLKKLPKYLDNERVIGIGEIGLNNGAEDEVELFISQLNIAKEHNMPIIIHSPARREPQLVPMLDQIIDVIRKENFPMDMVVLDHAAKNTLEARLKTGAMVGLSTCYDKNRPEDTAEMVAENPDKRDKLFINSELGYDQDGYFSVPRVAYEMRMLGLKREEIEKVTWDNPKKFFNLPVD